MIAKTVQNVRARDGGTFHIAGAGHSDGDIVGAAPFSYDNATCSSLLVFADNVHHAVILRSFAVGSLPLAFALTPSQLRLISSIGMGVLVGSSLTVIIPEGVETLYGASSLQAQKDLGARSIFIGGQQPEILNSRVSVDTLETTSSILQYAPSASVALPVPSADPDVVIFPDPREPEENKQKLQSRTDTESSSDTKSSKEERSSPHAWIGVALISGFILMYLIDKLPEFASPEKQQRTPYHISLDNLGSRLRRGSTSLRDGNLLDSVSNSRRSHGFATTVGLVIHAAADGIALGASSSDQGLSFIIFLAIMVHKAPASFGLTSVLLKQGLSTRAARAHLLIFSLAAPVGALATFLFMHAIGSSQSGDEESARWRTGMLLLFSAGTFL